VAAVRVAQLGASGFPGCRVLWATLIARVFLADAQRCPRRTRMHGVAALTDPDSIRT